MKVTSLKDMESYIYSSVILPLKELEVESLSMETPMRDAQGRGLQLSLTREEVVGDFHHNYQREAARTHARWVVRLRGGNVNKLVADYSPKRHTVRLYGWNQDSEYRMLMNKLAEAFLSNTPFDKVFFETGSRSMTAHIEDRAGEIPL